MKTMYFLMALLMTSIIGAAATAAEANIWQYVDGFSEPVGAVVIDGITASGTELVLHTGQGDVNVALPGRVDQVLDFSGTQVALKLLNKRGQPTGKLIVMDVLDGSARRLDIEHVYSARFLEDQSALVAVLWETHELVMLDEHDAVVVAEAVVPYSQFVVGSVVVFGQEDETGLGVDVVAMDLQSGEAWLIRSPAELQTILGEDISKSGSGETAYDALVAHRVAHDAARIEAGFFQKSLGITMKAPFRAGEQWLVTQAYGTAPDATSHAQSAIDRFALDFSMPECEAYGRDVLAIAPGRVTYAGGTSENGCSTRAGGYGQRVEIDHGNGLFSLYGHNSRLIVSVGDEVGYGTKIAECGNSGWACGSACPANPGTHIHLRLTESGAPVPPEPLDGVSNIVTGMWITSTNASATLAAPTLISPSDNTQLTGNEVTLRWNSVSGASGYQSQLSRSSSFSSPITSSERSSTSVTWSGFSSHTGRWYWRARAVNSAGNSPWSGARSFVVTTETSSAPSAPSLVSPDDNAQLTGNTVTLRWNSVSGASGYQSQLSRSSSFSSPIISSERSSTSVTWSGFSSHTGRWYWRARSVNSAGTSPWSSARSFVVTTEASSPPPPPALVSPDDNAQFTGNEVTLRWNSVSGASGYQSQLSRSSSFSSPITSSERSSTSVTWSGFSSHTGRWYWRARSVNSAGTSPWSSARSFVVTTAAVVTPSISQITPNPAPGSWNKTTMSITGTGFKSGATVTWRDVTNGTSYPGRAPVSLTSTSMTLTPVFGPYAAVWSAKVVNPDGRTSSEVYFNVYASK